jgi:hypothetical protein
MANIINQAFGQNWTFYNVDCVAGASNLPDNSIDSGMHSPLRFTELYIYKDKDKHQTKHPISRVLLNEMEANNV